LRWLHGQEVPRIALHQPVDHGAGDEPQGQEAIETEIRLVLACVVGEMLHLGADGRHLAADRDDVKRALAMAARLGDGDTVDALEPIFDDVCATLTSPRIRHAVTTLAGALIKAPAGEMLPPMFLSGSASPWLRRRRAITRDILGGSTSDDRVYGWEGAWLPLVA